MPIAMADDAIVVTVALICGCCKYTELTLPSVTNVSKNREAAVTNRQMLVSTCICETDGSIAILNM